MKQIFTYLILGLGVCSGVQAQVDAVQKLDAVILSDSKLKN